MTKLNTQPEMISDQEREELDEILSQFEDDLLALRATKSDCDRFSGASTKRDREFVRDKEKLMVKTKQIILARESKKILEALEAVEAEIIGDDEHYKTDDPRYKLAGEPFEWAERNSLRAEQRQALAKVKDQVKGKGE